MLLCEGEYKGCLNVGVFDFRKYAVTLPVTLSWHMLIVTPFLFSSRALVLTTHLNLNVMSISCLFSFILLDNSTVQL